MKDRISVLMDGELEDGSAAQVIDVLASRSETGDDARDAWRTYHLISDALGKSRMLSAGFSERVAAAPAGGLPAGGWGRPSRWSPGCSPPGEPAGQASRGAGLRLPPGSRRSRSWPGLG